MKLFFKFCLIRGFRNVTATLGSGEPRRTFGEPRLLILRTFGIIKNDKTHQIIVQSSVLRLVSVKNTVFIVANYRNQDAERPDELVRSRLKASGFDLCSRIREFSWFRLHRADMNAEQNSNRVLWALRREISSEQAGVQKVLRRTSENLFTHSGGWIISVSKNPYITKIESLNCHA